MLLGRGRASLGLVNPYWLPLLTAFIAAGSALAGTILSNYLARKDKRLEREWRSRQEAADFLISRGEELYVHLDRIESYIVDHSQLIELFCHGRLKLDDFKVSRANVRRDLEAAALSRVKLNVRAFFPKLLPQYTELLTNLSRLDIIDQALIEGDESKAGLLYRISHDASRLKESVIASGEQLRDDLAHELAAAFTARASAGSDP